MSYTFANKRLICPYCKEHDPIKREDRIIGPNLYCIDRWPDCGHDVGECEQCLKNFQVSYKIDIIEEC